jgi:hypothetical protein
MKLKILQIEGNSFPKYIRKKLPEINTVPYLDNVNKLEVSSELNL